MIVFSINLPNRTITIHKKNCKKVQRTINGINLNQYPNGYQVGKNQFWFDENQFSILKVQNLFKNKDYGKTFCSFCF